MIELLFPLFVLLFEMEIDNIIDPNEFYSGKCFGDTYSNNNNNNNSVFNKNIDTPIVKQKRKKKFKPPSMLDSNHSSNKNVTRIGYKNVSKNKIPGIKRKNIKIIRPRNDPNNIKNPVILNKCQLNDDYSSKNDADLVPVVVDKFLSEYLREHQKDGIIFMYKCLMGIKNSNEKLGLILADEMGLGMDIL